VPIPPEPVLRAAVRWLQRLPQSGVARCRALFSSHRDYSDLTPTQYDAALAWLSSTGLLDKSDVRAPQHRVFEAAIRGDIRWFPDADMLVRTADELPEDALRAAEVLEISRNEAFQRIAAVWGKVDAEERARIGADGELALVTLLCANTRARVNHVAAESDSFGYDISVSMPGFVALLEVKTTRRHARLNFYLSRNEFETMRREAAWHLVVVHLNEDSAITALRTVPSEWIVSAAPHDTGASSRWESARFDVPPAVTEQGLPFLEPTLKLGHDGLLTG
jgi:hypothetical protein